MFAGGGNKYDYYWTIFLAGRRCWEAGENRMGRDNADEIERLNSHFPVCCNCPLLAHKRQERTCAPLFE